MAQIRAKFEKEIKEKLSQKIGKGQSEELVLLKAFKYYDLQNTGSINQQQFKQAIEKSGINFLTYQEVSDLFNYYDINKQGYVNYTDLVSMIFNNSTGLTRQLASETRSNEQAFYEENIFKINQLIFQIKQQLKKKSIYALISFLATLKKQDILQQGQIEVRQFKSALQAELFNFKDYDIELLFKFYDKLKQNKINYQDFIDSITGSLSIRRKEVISQAYLKINKNTNMPIKKQILFAKFDARLHPEAIEGQKPLEQVKCEFQQSWNLLLQIKGIFDQLISFEHFQYFCSLISGLIDSDSHFEQVVLRPWKTSELSDEIITQEDKISQLLSSNKKQSQLLYDYDKKDQIQTKLYQSPIKNYSPIKSYPILSRSFFQKIFQQIKTFGIKFTLAFAQQLKSQQNINQAQLKAIFCSNRIVLEKDEFEQIFQSLDLQNINQISGESLLREIIREMPFQRKSIVANLFKQLDECERGFLDVESIKQKYNFQKMEQLKLSLNLPLKSIDHQLFDFLNIFNIFTTLLNNYNQLNLQQFQEFYDYVSHFINHDETFKAFLSSSFIINTFKEQQQVAYKKQLPFGISGQEKLETTQQQLNYSNNDKERLQNSSYAGISSWTKGQIALQPRYNQTLYRQEEMQLKFSNDLSAKKQNQVENSTYKSQLQQKSIPSKYQFNITDNSNMQCFQEILSSFKNKLMARGKKGIFQFIKQIESIDSQFTNFLNYEQFQQCFKLQRIFLNDDEIKIMFDQFDTNKNGQINYLQLLQTIIGKMSEFRFNFVEEAYNKLQQQLSGQVTLSALKEIFDPIYHPDVQQQNKTEEQILDEFITTIELHHQNNNKMGTDAISFDEFVNYYTNLSFQIPDDRYFEFMVKTAWQL